MSHEVIYSGAMPSSPSDYYAIALGGSRMSYVYILTGERGDALYVGMSRRPGNRFDKHRSRDWWGQVEGLTVWRVEGEDRWHADRNARRLEAHAIRELLPAYNIAGVPR